jgi:hypothetical protein
MAISQAESTSLVPYGPVKVAIDSLVTQVVQHFAVEHNDDGTHGAITATSITSHSRTTPMGTSVTPTFAATDFTGNNAQTWTVDAADASNIYYTVFGNIMTLFFTLTTTSVGGVADTQLIYRIPGGYVPSAKVFAAAITITDNGVLSPGVAQINGPTASVLFIRGDGTNWTASANNTSIRGQLSFEVQ